MTNRPFAFLSPLRFDPPAHPLSLAACLIGVVSMAKVGIVGQRGNAKVEEESVELGER